MRLVILLLLFQYSLCEETSAKRYVINTKLKSKTPRPKIEKSYDSKVVQAIKESHSTFPHEVVPLTEDDYHPPHQLVQQVWLPSPEHHPASIWEHMARKASPVKKIKENEDKTSTDIRLEEAILDTHTYAPWEARKLTEEEYNPPQTVEQYWVKGNDLRVASVRRHPTGGVVPHVVVPAHFLPAASFSAKLVPDSLVTAGRYIPAASYSPDSLIAARRYAPDNFMAADSYVPDDLIAAGSYVPDDLITAGSYIPDYLMAAGSYVPNRLPAAYDRLLPLDVMATRRTPGNFLASRVIPELPATDTLTRSVFMNRSLRPDVYLPDRFIPGASQAVIPSIYPDMLYYV